MENMKFAVGSYDDFAKYIESLKDAKSVICVSHTDLDGIASAKVVDSAVTLDKVMMIDYVDMNLQMAEKIKAEKPSHIIMTDLMVEKKDFLFALTEFAEVLLIDHHVPDLNLKMSGLTYINVQSRCAAYVAYNLFSSISEIEDIDWLVVCASLSDVQTDGIPEFMNEVFKKYGEDYKDIKNSKFWELVIGITNSLIYYHSDKMKVYNLLTEEFHFPNELKKVADIVQDDIEFSLDDFEKKKIKFSSGYYWNFTAKYKIKSIVSTILSFKYPNKTILIGKLEGDKFLLSARRQDRQEDMNLLLKKLTEGFENSGAGGHVPAAGGYIMKKDVKEFENRLMKL